MILASIFLGLASLLPFHHTAKPRIQHRAPDSSLAVPVTPKTLYGFDLSTEDMQSEADQMELNVLEALPGVKQRYKGLIPDAVYTALIDDVLKLGNESVLAPTFKDDWNKFGADIDTMSAEIEWVDSQSRI